MNRIPEFILLQNFDLDHSKVTKVGGLIPLLHIILHVQIITPPPPHKMKIIESCKWASATFLPLQKLYIFNMYLGEVFEKK